MRALPVLSFLCASMLASSLVAQSNAPQLTVAITIDDLPFVTGNDARPMSPEDAREASLANHKLLDALARRHIPVTGFVNQKGAEDLGIASGKEILGEWTRDGFDLGNHTYAHLDFNDLTVAQFEDQVTRGESMIRSLMQTVHRKVEFFRFPFNHTGDTQEKHDALAAFLAGRGYRTAPCSIETSDWMFNAAYTRMRVKHDEAAMARLRSDYLAFTATQVDYFIRLDRQVLGYDAPQIMLIHDNQLNADVMNEILTLFEKRHFRLVSLAEAESDPVYRQPDAFVARFGRYGPMWGYRWAAQRGVKVDGRLEPEPPKWIEAYGKP